MCRGKGDSFELKLNELKLYELNELKLHELNELKLQIKNELSFFATTNYNF